MANSEPVIFPACSKIVNIMFGVEYEKDIPEILMSHDTISRRIQDMSQGGEFQVIANIREADSFLKTEHKTGG